MTPARASPGDILLNSTSPLHPPYSAPTHITSIALKPPNLAHKSLHKNKAYHPIIKLTQRLLSLKVRAIFSKQKGVYMKARAPP